MLNLKLHIAVNSMQLIGTGSVLHRTQQHNSAICTFHSVSSRVEDGPGLEDLHVTASKFFWQVSARISLSLPHPTCRGVTPDLVFAMTEQRK